MGAVAKKLEQDLEVRQRFAVVVALAGAGWRVRDDSGAEFQAARAVGCLVEPQVRDRVLVALGTDREAYVLSVVTREGADGVVLSSTGDVTVAAPNGAFRVAAREAIELASNAGVSITSPKFDLVARAGSLAIQTLAFVGEKVAAEVTHVKTVSETVDTLMDRFTQRVKRAFRFVEEVDTLQAEQVDHSVKETYHLRARHALVHTEKLVKMDGESIQLG